MTLQPVDVQLLYAGDWHTVPAFVATPIKIERGGDGESGLRPLKIECALDNDDLSLDPSNPSSPLYGQIGRNTQLRVRHNGQVRAVGEVSSWKPTATVDHVPGARRGRAQTAVVAQGVLRRIGQWTEPIRSPMYRWIAGGYGANLVGHWSFEDGRDADRVANSNGPAGSVSGGVTFAETDTPGGAATTVKVTSGGRLTGSFNRASGSSWQLAFSLKMPALPAVDGVYHELVRWRTTAGYTWAWSTDDSAYRVTVTDSAGVVRLSSPIGHGGGAAPNQWVTFRIKVSQSGGTVTVEPAWYPHLSGAIFGYTDTFSGSAGTLHSWVIVASSAVSGTLYSHLFGVNTVNDDLFAYNGTASFNGYAGEPAGWRFERLCQEMNIPYMVTGADVSDTLPMGAQRPATFEKLLAEIADTDDALIYDDPTDIGLVMRPRRARQSLPATLALTYPDDIAAGLSKAIDDLDVGNVVTVKNASGSEVTARRVDGPMGVDTIGEYRKTVDVSTDDARVADLAGWHLAKRTQPGPRWPEIPVDLTATGGHVRVDDTFARVLAGEWGDDPTGRPWQEVGATPADFSTTGSAGRHTHTVRNVLRLSLIDVESPDVDVLSSTTIALGSATGGPVSVWTVGRVTDGSNYYAAILSLGPGTGMSLQLAKRVGGVLTSGLDSVPSVGTHTGGAAWLTRLQVAGTTVRAKAWLFGFWEPDEWHVEITDTDLAAGTMAGVGGRFESTNTNTLPQVIDYGDFTAAALHPAEVTGPGDVLTVDGLAADQLAHEVIGTHERIGSHERVMTFTVRPYDVWRAGEWDATTSRWDAYASTLAAARDATQTAWTVTAPTREDCWSTTAEPYDWLVAGERVTVTTMNAPTGTGPFTQTCTVVRSVNGVVKAQAAGEAVHVATPGRWAL